MTPPIQNDEIKLGRVGHYSYQNVCQTAMVVFVDVGAEKVNVAGYSHTGDGFRREAVLVGPVEGDDAEFHLNAACPWNR